MNKEIVIALVCLVGSLALYSSLGTISEETARVFPRVVVVVMIVLSALMLLQGLAWVLRNGLFLAGVDTALPRAEGGDD